MNPPLGVGLYGTNGHQIQKLLDDYPDARLAAVCEVPRESLTQAQRADSSVRVHDSLESMLDDPRVHFVSLCSSRRADQAGQAVSALNRGKHVYAEKPCALSEAALDEIVRSAGESSGVFHEMAGTAFKQPYHSMRELIAAGTVGEVVQVYAQKSYPYHDRRPQDEAVDGGLLLQVGVHALRFIEHVAGVRVAEIEALETGHGNPAHGNLRMATSLLARLENGGVASVVANYLHQHWPIGTWGNECLRVWGDRGLVEADDGGTSVRLLGADGRCEPFSVGPEPPDYLYQFFDSVLGRSSMPLELEEELHPTRMVIRAKEQLGGGRPHGAHGLA
jgi:predicted dehydrogenase